MTIQISVKDLPEHHLELIAPTDPVFQERLVDALAGKEAHPLAEELQPYCVLFVNKGTKVVAGYRVKWEITRADGTVSTRQTGGLNAGALIGKRQQGSKTTPPDDEFVLKPNSTSFVSLAGSLVLFGGGSIIAFAGGSSDPAAIDQFRLSQDPSALGDSAVADLRNYTAISISIDGVVFEDGTFVGPDTTGLFSSVEAMFKARRDLLDEVAFRFERKPSVDIVFSYIEETASNPLPDQKLDPEGLYNLYKKLEAEAVLRMRTATDGERVVEWLLHDHRQAWPELKRL